MTPPTDPIVALRALVEAMIRGEETRGSCRVCGAWWRPGAELLERHYSTCRMLAAREALEWLDLPSDVCPCGREASEAIGDPLYDHTPECVVWLKARVARLEEALRTLMEWGVELDDVRLHYISVQIERADIKAARAALEGRDE